MRPALNSGRHFSEKDFVISGASDLSRQSSGASKQNSVKYRDHRFSENNRLSNS
jgi:hypothetical protein